MKIRMYKIVLILFLSGTSSLLHGQKQVIQEHQIKAVFLFNFIQFVEWPLQAFDSIEAPVVIGILGKDPFGPYLDEVLSGEVVNGRPVIVKRFSTVSEIENCHILYIHNPPIDNYQTIFNKIEERNILTISDDVAFMKEGGMIRFVNVNNRVQFQINPDAAKKANLTISSKLLRLAEIVAVNEKK